MEMHGGSHHVCLPLGMPTFLVFVIKCVIFFLHADCTLQKQIQLFTVNMLHVRQWCNTATRVRINEHLTAQLRLYWSFGTINHKTIFLTKCVTFLRAEWLRGSLTKVMLETQISLDSEPSEQKLRQQHITANRRTLGYHQHSHKTFTDGNACHLIHRTYTGNPSKYY